MLALGTTDNVALIKFLIDKGADVNLADRGQYTALHFAAINLNNEEMLALLKAAADPNAPEASGWTPLHHVLRRPDPRGTLVWHLVRHGADPDQTDGAGISPRSEAEGKNNWLERVKSPKRQQKKIAKGSRSRHGERMEHEQEQNAAGPRGPGCGQRREGGHPSQGSVHRLGR